MRRLLPTVLALLAVAGAGPSPALAENGDPLPLTEAYRYVAADGGDAIEIDWVIEDGYYLYRDAMRFETSTPGVTLGAPALPEGEIHDDQYLGPQAIYRERFFVRVPYNIDGERPDSLELTIHSRGCWETGGICFPPQAWEETVPLRAAAGKPRLDLASLGKPSGLGGEFVHVDEAFQAVLIPVDGNTVEVSFAVLEGYYLYRDKIGVRAVTDGVQLGRLQLPDGEIKNDETFGEVEVYHQDVFARLPVARATPEPMQLQLAVDYQGCADGGLCYTPQTRTLTVSLPAATGDIELADAGMPPLSDQGRKANIITNASLWAVIASFFGFGLLLAFTPCVLPMIPILTSIIAGEGENTGALRGFVLALSYVLGMAIVYTGAGVVAVAAGAQVQAAFNQPWVLSIFAGLFVVLAIAMFGGYDLQMPSAIQSRLAGISSNQKSGTLIGAFIMGALSSLIVTACVAPALVAALAVMAQTGDYLRGGVALFAMSLGMGAPLLAVGAAQGQLLPRVGPWMMAVKGVFGFMMLGLAIWMLARFLPGALILTLWAVLAVVAGVFMGGLTTLTSESTATQKLGRGLGLLVIVYGLAMLFGAMTGGSNPLKPLATVSFGGGTAAAEAEGLEFRRIKTVADLERELAAASASGKSAMLDFYADWCTSCIEMEHKTFTDAGVQDALADTVLLQADVTANDADDQALLNRFGVFGPPTIIFFGADGAQRRGYEVVGFMKAAAFIAHVEQALAAPSGLAAR